MTASTSKPTRTINQAPPASSGRRQFLGYTGASVLAAVLPGCGSNDDTQYANTLAWAAQRIRQAIADKPQSVASISVALLKGTQVVWAQAFGNASVSPPIAATPQTRYNIGSVTKVITALAAIILQDRGQIGLDVPIVEYLPSFTMLSPEYAQITTRHLLSHSSGLPGQNYCNAFTYTPIGGYAAAAQTALANEHLNHPPSQFQVYCNDGFTLFEQVVLAVTGQSYPEFVQQNILTPLNMTRSSFLTSEPANGTSGFALGYANGIQGRQEFVNVYASGGLSTTPTDMMNLAQVLIGNGMFQSRRIASAAGIAEMRRPQPNQLQNTLDQLDLSNGYGLGWDEGRSSTLATAGIAGSNKSGGSGLFSTYFYALPDAQMALLITGSNGYEASRIASDIVFQALVEDGTLAKAPQLLNVSAPPTATPPDVSAAAGIYANASAPIQVLVNANGSLTLNQWNGNAWALLEASVVSYQYRSDGWWWHDGGTTSYRFDTLPGTDDAGNPVSYRYLTQRTVAGYSFTTLALAQQLKNLPPLSTAWQARMNTSWKVLNESDQSVTFQPALLQLRLGILQDLPGYVLFSASLDGGASFGLQQLLKPLADNRGGMAVRIPIEHGRDLFEISFSGTGSVETMSASGWQCQRI